MNKFILIALSFIGFSSPSWAAEAGTPLWENPNIWMLISFILFVLLVTKPAFKAIGAMLDKRSEEIEARLEEARKLKEEAIHMRAEAERIQHEAIEEAGRIVEYAKKDAEDIQQKGKESLSRTIEKKKDIVNQRILVAQSQALNDIKAQTADIAYKATHKLIDQDYTPADDDNLIDDTINNLSDLMQNK
ncbi:MAG: hypothetical protein ACK5MJ_04925 [Alphaproteobacteria bacterium]